MRIGLDIDGVLANFTKGFERVIRETSGRTLLTKADIARPRTWEWALDAGYTKAENDAAWELIKNSQSFWANLQPLPGAGSLVRQLTMRESGYEVCFITNRMGRDPMGQTLEFLEENFGVDDLPVIITPYKGLACKIHSIDVYLDDKTENILDVQTKSPDTTAIVLDYPYNHDSYDIVHRVKTLAEFGDLL